MNVIQTLKNIKSVLFSTLLVINVFCLSAVNAQEVDEVRWKSEQQVRDLYGDPISVHGPVGTHASYILWKYDDYTVAFANNRAFHLFNKDSLTKIVLEEDR